MAYIFKKIGNLIDDQVSAMKAQGQVIGQGNGSNINSIENSTTSNQNTHESTYKNPNAIYDANYGADMGKLNSGIDQSLSDANTQLQSSTKEYQGRLGDVGKNYEYNGRSDVEKINDKDVYGRLSRITNSEIGKTALGSVDSKSKYYNADTSATANLSSVEGLTNQLQNQNGSTRGGSRLDALLYRNSGQAGRAINNDLMQIDGFRDGKEQLLNNEKNVLNNSQQTIVDNSNKLKNDGSVYREDLLKSAKNEAIATQEKYNAAREAEAKKLEEWKNSFNVRDIIAKEIEAGRNGRQIIRSVSGDTPGAYMTSEGGFREKGGKTPAQYSKDFSQETVDKLLENSIKEIDYSKINTDSFLNSTKNYNENMFLDGRFNQLGQLLGLEQRISETAPDLSVGVDSKGYQEAVNAAVAKRANEARNMADRLFQAQTSGGGGFNLEDVINNPLVQGIATGGQSFIWRPVWNKISSWF